MGLSLARSIPRARRIRRAAGAPPTLFGLYASRGRPPLAAVHVTSDRFVSRVDEAIRNQAIESLPFVGRQFFGPLRGSPTF